MIHKVTGVLAKEDINIAFMRVFRSSRRQDACMIIEADGKISGNIPALIREEAEDDVADVCLLQ